MALNHRLINQYIGIIAPAQDKSPMNMSLLCCSFNIHEGIVWEQQRGGGGGGGTAEDGLKVMQHGGGGREGEGMSLCSFHLQPGAHTRVRGGGRGGRGCMFHSDDITAWIGSRGPFP